MCSIAGMISKRGQNVFEQIVQMLSVMKHRGPDSAGVAITDEAVVANEPNQLDFSDLKGDMAIGHTGLAITIRPIVPQPLTDCNGELFLVHDGEIYNSEELRRRLASHDFETMADSEVIVHLVEENDSSNLFEAVSKALPRLDGVYALALMRGSRIAIARDPVGVKPLYWGESGDRLAFASERKALWKVGITSVTAFPPGHMATMTNKTWASSPALTLKKPAVADTNLDIAASKLRDRLYSAFEKRVRGVKNIGIAFSGGVDSSLTAKIADDLGAKVVLYTAGLEGAYDIEAAESSASELGYPLHTRTLSMDEIEEYVFRAVYAIEEVDVMKVDVGLPLYAAAELAHSHGIRVIFSGQGSDELFGGYAKYPQILQSGGYEKMHDEMWNDVLQMFDVNLQRDDAVVMANGVELRVPFSDPEVINTAMSFHPELMVSSPYDPLRKRVLRKAAETSGLPTSIVNRPKKSAQYGSGVDRAVRKLAKKHGHRRPRNYIEAIFNEVFRDLGVVK